MHLKLSIHAPADHAPADGSIVLFTVDAASIMWICVQKMDELCMKHGITVMKKCTDCV